MFNTELHGNGTSLKFVDVDGNGDIALKTTAQHGFIINSKDLALADTNFLLELDVRFEKVGGNSNTVQYVASDGTTDTHKTGLMPTNKDNVTIDEVKYSSTYTTTQNLSDFKYPSGVSSAIPVLPDQWYHYAFYIDVENAQVKAYRDQSLIWTATLGVFPETTKKAYIRIFSGHNSTVAYYDNIHIQSLNSMDINMALDFEDIAIADDATSVTATSSMLTPALGYENMMSYPYVHASNKRDMRTSSYTTCSRRRLRFMSLAWSMARAMTTSSTLRYTSFHTT
jgi:hypothetical protein